MKQIILEMQKLSGEHRPYALATIISRNGSAPRSAGAKMLVRPDGSSLGTVGGGTLEAQVIRLALQMHSEQGAVIQEFQFTGKDAATMDAICGGQVEVLVEWVDPINPHMTAIVNGLATAIQQHRKAWLITSFSPAEKKTTQALLHPDGVMVGALPAGITPEGIIESQLPILVECSGSLVLVEPINIDGTAYIFGAGHVSRSLATFTKAVGFWTVVLDDRPEYANRERFSVADEVLVLDSMENVLKQVAIDPDSYVVIVTRGHQDDQKVLAQVLKTGAAYIGMIGSRRKCELIFQELRRLGFNEEEIQRVHSPIGIPISAETPEEIGISIVAEMIHSRSQSRLGN